MLDFSFIEVVEGKPCRINIDIFINAITHMKKHNNWIEFF